MRKLLVIGGVSSDVLHLQGRTAATAGGAGMYTAMAARRCGVDVSLFGARPDICPEPLQPVDRLLSEWLGPLVPPDKLPQFEISYRHGKTEYLQILLNAETTLEPSLLPADLSGYDLIHVTPLGDANRQLAFIHACKQRGAKCISAGTGLFIAEAQPHLVQKIGEQADYFFMNKREAEIVFGSADSASVTPGKVLFVTQGAKGAAIRQGDFSTPIEAVPAIELDPTGAGDTFCGATLAYLLQNEHSLMAARHAAALAAEMITQVGPSALLLDDPPPKVPLDGRVRINDDQVQQVAKAIAVMPEAAPFPFVSPELPPVGHAQTVDYFFAATLQQFSFWSTDNNHYHKPLIALIDGAELKGSDYLWEAFRRRLEREPEFCSPERQANLSREEMEELFRADDGEDPMPALDWHLQQANSYGRDMLALNLTPQGILQQALASAEPLQTFIGLLDKIGGYKEDPLRKKSSLLAMILDQRPEKFLPLRDGEEIAPVIDYHVLRSCLRIGLVDIIDEELRRMIVNRVVISAAEEWAVRHAAYQATEAVVAQSGRSTGAVDWFFFSARKRCPEMKEPACDLCPVDSICAHSKELFQPVIRTTFY